MSAISIATLQPTTLEPLKHQQQQLRKIYTHG